MLYQKAAANYSFPPHPPLERWLKAHLLLSEQERWVRGKGPRNPSLTFIDHSLIACCTSSRY